jgi:uncharacterized protein (DUF488 family)
MAESESAMRSVLTIGHSTRTLEAFTDLLRAHDATALADVRTIPRSRHNPQFNRETLPGALDALDIEYAHIAGLGGLRRPQRDSANAGWRMPGFRGYADYMLTAEFGTNLEDLMELAKRQRVALMCAEAVPWRCHRSLIADALVVRGFPVEHILSNTRSQPHKLTPWAQIDGSRILYPPETIAMSFKPNKE